MSQSSPGRALGVSTSTPTLDGLTVSGTALATVAVIELGNANDKLSFYGVTATVQSATIGTIASGTAATTATYGTPTPDIATLFTAVNAITAALRSKGIIAT